MSPEDLLRPASGPSTESRTGLVLLFLRFKRTGTSRMISLGISVGSLRSHTEEAQLILEFSAELVYLWIATLDPVIVARYSLSQLPECHSTMDP